MIIVSQSLDLEHIEHKNRAIEVLKNSIANEITRILIEHEIIEFQHSEDKVGDFINQKSTAKLFVIKKNVG